MNTLPEVKVRFHEKYEQFMAEVKIVGLTDWKLVYLKQVDYYGRQTGRISIFATKEDARKHAQKFAQRLFNKISANRG